MLDLWKLSHFDTRFYRHVGQFPGWKIVFYLIGFYLILGVALTTLFAMRTWPEWKKNVQLTWETTQQQWPEDTAVQLRNNQLQLFSSEDNKEDSSDEATASATTSKIEIRWPKEISQNSRLPNLLVIFDPQANAEQVQKHPSWFVATQDALWIKSSTGQFDSFSWLEIAPNENWTINQSFFEQQQSTFSDGLNAALYPTLFLVFLWYSIVRIGARSVSLIFMSWLAHPILSLFGWQIDYKKTYRVGAFLLPIAEELTFLLRLLYPENQYFSFWLIWIMALLIIGWTNRKMMLLAKNS